MASALLCFLVASALWVALSVPVMMPAAAAHGQAGKHCPPTACGSVSISFPFGLVPEDGALKNSCGRIGFQVRCRNNAPYLGTYHSEHDLQILRIFYDNGSLIMSKTSKLGFFINTTSGSSSCHIPTGNTSSELGPPFSISPVNQKLIFYNCTKPLSPGGGLVETICGDNTYVRVAAGRSDNKLSNYFMDGCVAAVVPVFGTSANKMNASNYEELVRGGFLVTWQQGPRPSAPSA
nr:unnamed protein product [Digitaria exilis]